ncbi:hypothetical protein PIB30_033962, partial [Stylosanthes scabra]|nr:hypothetical protein [Stylosanthes scabra]
HREGRTRRHGSLELLVFGVISEHSPNAEKDDSLPSRRTSGAEGFGHEGKPREEQAECNFFQSVDKRRVREEQTKEDPEMARLRRKVASLKLKVKSIEWKLHVVDVVGFVG